MGDRRADPGWNDPPMLNYSLTNPPPKSRIFNKRVAFPMTPTSSNIAKDPSIATISNIDKFIRDNNINNISINERLVLLRKALQEKSLSENVQKIVFEITVNLCENNVRVAEELLEKLGTESWVGAIRDLVETAKSKQL